MEDHTRKIYLREKQRINYYEPEDPPLDEHIFCNACGDYVYEYCSIHGPLLIIPDEKPPDTYPGYVPRAALTIPHVFLHIAPSTIPGAGLGVFATRTIPCDVRFGPFCGQRTYTINSVYCWQIYDSNNRSSHVIDATDAERSNWMRYVNCSRHWFEQNLVAYQYRGEIYYRTVKIIPKFTELMVFYGAGFASCLKIDLKHYNSPVTYGNIFGSPALKNSEIINKEKEENLKPDVLKHIEKNTSFNKVEDIDYTMVKYNISPNCREEENLASKYYDLNRVDLKSISNSENDIFGKKQIVICNECYEQFDSKCLLIEHLEKHAKENLNLKTVNSTNNSIPKCNENFQTDPESGKFCCAKCDYKHTQKRHVRSHFLIVHGEKKFSCLICSRKFARNYRLKNHLVTHTGERKYICSICSRKFYSRRSLKRHLNEVCKNGLLNRTDIKTISIKSDFQEHKCQICYKEYASLKNLKRHLGIHIREKLILCPKCPKRFYTNGKLKRHLQVHERGTTFYCLLCPLTFKFQNNLNAHLLDHKDGHNI